MKVIVVGATGTIGSEVAAMLEREHEVVRVSRQSAPPIDFADNASIAAMLGSVPASTRSCVMPPARR